MPKLHLVTLVLLQSTLQVPRLHQLPITVVAERGRETIVGNLQMADTILDGGPISFGLIKQLSIKIYLFMFCYTQNIGA